MVAAEGLGELGGLPVADGACDAVDGERAVLQELAGPRHPDALEVAPEAGLTRFGESALELAPRRGDPAGHVVERQALGVVAVDQLGGLLEQLPATVDRGLSLRGGRHLDEHTQVRGDRIAADKLAPFGTSKGAGCRFATG